MSEREWDESWPPDLEAAVRTALDTSEARPALAIPRKGDWMQTASGRRLYPLDPRPEEEDVFRLLGLEWVEPEQRTGREALRANGRQR